MRGLGFYFVPGYGGYERVSILAWHLGQVTRILPLPLGTDSIWPQLGHLRYAVVLRPFHIFLAVRLARSKSSLLVPAAREVLAAAAPPPKLATN